MKEDFFGLTVSGLHAIYATASLGCTDVNPVGGSVIVTRYSKRDLT